ncbi:hypothetical protein Ahy_A01g004735 [Arachis hypogaea]|uniref:Protein FAR1-RELATED SEQUENCE n=1 Tax=Arachis hypogaea TaxID=3818 RepID=A0A445EWY4_ARAHY|nr:hypothetical protein Ahy_A01g004735 [Arachis hypogaea]
MGIDVSTSIIDEEEMIKRGFNFLKSSCEIKFEQFLCDVDEQYVPKVRMTFNTFEKAKKFYKDYSKLAELFEDRHLWIPVYFDHHFWIGMRSTQKSESMHIFFNKFTTRNSSFIQFIKKYNNCLGSKE